MGLRRHGGSQAIRPLSRLRPPAPRCGVRCRPPTRTPRGVPQRTPTRTEQVASALTLRRAGRYNVAAIGQDNELGEEASQRHRHQAHGPEMESLQKKVECFPKRGSCGSVRDHSGEMPCSRARRHPERLGARPVPRVWIHPLVLLPIRARPRCRWPDHGWFANPEAADGYLGPFKVPCPIPTWSSCSTAGRGKPTGSRPRAWPPTSALQTYSIARAFLRTVGPARSDYSLRELHATRRGNGGRSHLDSKPCGCCLWAASRWPRLRLWCGYFRVRPET